MTQLLSWHRWAGIVALGGVLLWATSGVLHPIMARMQPRPATLLVAADVPLPTAALPLAEVLARHGRDAIADARPVALEGVAYCQVTRVGAAEREYYAVLDGARAADGDRRYAESLARRFAGDSAAAVASARLQTRFDGEYADVNRLLPVWRIELDRADGMRVFVDTGTDRLGTLVDRTKRMSSTVFGALHRWDWLDEAAPKARLALLATLLVAALGATLGGLWLFLARLRQPGRRGLRRVHRAFGATLSFVALMFFGSGLYHLLHVGLRGDPAQRAAAIQPRVDPASLGIGFLAAAGHAGIAAPARISLADIDGEVFYRVQPPTERGPQVTSADHGGHASHAPVGKATPSQVAFAAPVYVSARDGAILPDGELRYAASIARRVTGRETSATITPVTRFAGEYGFVFKRLPVQRVPLADSDGRTAYVDTADGTVAAVIDDADRREGWFFANVHKHDWLVPLIGRDARDAVAAVLALLVGATAAMGGVLFARRRRRDGPSVGGRCASRQDSLRRPSPP